MASCIGWDIGGAHLKAARAEGGRIVAVAQLPCPLWLGLDRLDAAFVDALQRLGLADRHAATMTGELADIFESRRAGVAAIASAAVRNVAPAPLLLYAGSAGWLRPEFAVAHIDAIASANWHATAALLGRSVPDAILVDIGSTTTDIVPIAGGKVAAHGTTDAARLACGELVYTGFVRTSLMAIADRAPFAGAWTPLACEHFATAADVYRILGELDEAADQMPTADGRDKTVAASIARLARMIGRDAADADAATWRGLAAWFAERQLRRIADAAMLVLSRLALPASAPLLVAGSGSHLGGRLAARLGRSTVDSADLFPLAAEPCNGLSVLVGQCAPAAAMAVLADG